MTTRIEFAKDILAKLGIVPGEANCDCLVAVMSFEDSRAVDNPLDTTLPEQGATNFNTVGVKDYDSLAQGVEATVATLNEGRYVSFRDVLRGSDANTMARTLAEGGWAGTDPATISSYAHSLSEMIATVEEDRSKYYDVEVTPAKADEAPIVPLPEPKPEPERQPEPEAAKVESAIDAQVEQIQDDEASKDRADVPKLITKIKIHLAELEKLLG